MWLAWCGALLIGISLGLLGSGGSILTVPVLIYLVGEPEKLAIAESLGIVAAISFIGSIPYVIKKEVHWVSLIFFGIPGMIGTYGGASLSQYISGNTQLMIFAGVMIIAAFMMIRERTKISYKKPASIPKWVLVIEGLAVGVLTGLVGVGGGFLIIPALVLIGGLSMRVAVGTSLLIITLKSILGFYKYIDVLAMEGLGMNWELIGVFSLIGIAGSFVGNKISQKVPQKQLKTGFGYFLMVMGAYIIYTNF
ncbi:MAG: sulfite exporter TauE/SafE family protein [Gracilimonas sp.]|uniref:sulfite exporter TauE/SafE family protein n=1 Tax=Gracilimonas TaxID=649462 RepID=UPI001B1F5CDC|nr:sulfite exporter TauE/SafE family protein [Gracilimonas sp.]MBO6585720.1 sulfite exporter TauE/SafE family protein [Gracilimonas sp.]MBO6616717.1 sulfite exporter TauE/SafE family protein [Gracilimonas sp.]